GLIAGFRGCGTTRRQPSARAVSVTDKVSVPGEEQVAYLAPPAINFIPQGQDRPKLLGVQRVLPFANDVTGSIRFDEDLVRNVSLLIMETDADLQDIFPGRDRLQVCQQCCLNLLVLVGCQCPVGRIVLQEVVQRDNTLEAICPVTTVSL